MPLLTMSDISKRFAGVAALAGVEFDARAGEVHALMGENGAGKSTLMKIAAGVYAPDSGTIGVDGSEAVFRSAADAYRTGIRTVFQELTVLENLDVGRNIMIGREPTSAGGLAVDFGELYAEAQAQLDQLGIGLRSQQPIASLSTGQKQMVEIARACAGNPKVLILDEPTSSLGQHEEETLFALVKRLKAAGVGIVYITHRMPEVFKLADRITVLRDGRHVTTGETRIFTRDSLIRAMVGRPVEARQDEPVRAGEPIVRVEGLTRLPKVKQAGLDLHAGEVIGLGGLLGSGRTELARLIAGIDLPRQGRMTLDGKPFAPSKIADAIAAGVAYLPEDRKTLGLLLSLTVGENIALPSLRRLSKRGFLASDRIRSMAKEWMTKLAVKAKGPDSGVSTLSGGNQQKVALAKWLATGPRVLLLDEPTRGVDVGAKAEIHKLIRQLARDGAAVLVISSELPELLTVSDRIAMMAHGRIAGIIDAKGATEEALLQLAFSEPPDKAAA